MWNLLNIKRGYNYLPHNVKKDAITTLKDYVTEKKGLFLHPCNEDTDEVLKFDDKGVLRLVKIAPEEVVADDLAVEGNAADEGAVLKARILHLQTLLQKTTIKMTSHIRHTISLWVICAQFFRQNDHI